MKNKKAILGIFAALVVVAVVALGANSELFQGMLGLQTNKDARLNTSILEKLSGTPTDGNSIFRIGTYSGPGTPQYSNFSTFKKAVQLGKLKNNNYYILMADTEGVNYRKFTCSSFSVDDYSVECSSTINDRTVSALIGDTWAAFKINIIGDSRKMMSEFTFYENLIIIKVS